MRASPSARFAEFLRRLAASPPARTYAEARRQVADVLNAVELELAKGAGGRLMAPEDESERPSASPACRRFRTAAHNTVFGENGAVWIVALPGPSQPWSAGTAALDKPGLDGRRADEL